MATVIGPMNFHVTQGWPMRSLPGTLSGGFANWKGCQPEPRNVYLCHYIPYKAGTVSFKKLNKNKYFSYFKITNGFSLHLKPKLMATIPEPSASLTCAHMTFPFGH